MLARILSIKFNKTVICAALAASGTALVVACAERAKADDAMATKASPIPYANPAAYNWNGFYAGGQMGYTWGTSNWTASSPGAPNVSGSLSLAQRIDIFSQTGSFFAGLQAGYNYMLPNRIVVGGEVDATFPTFPDRNGISTGGITNLTSPTLGAETYSETVLASGTVRGRIGYAPGSWLFYATGGFAWTYDQQSLTQVATGANESPFLWRLGYAAGAGVEAPVAPHWTARLEYLFTGYGNHSTSFFGGAQQFTSDFSRATGARRFELSVRQRRRAGVRAADRYQRASGSPTWTWSISTARPRSCGKAIRPSDRPIRVPTACRTAARPARRRTPRCSPACDCGKAPNSGSIRKSIRASASATRTASPASRARKPTRSAPITLMSACSALSFARPSISAATRKSWKRTSINSPARRLPIAWCCGSGASRSPMYSTPTNTPTAPRPISSTGRWSIPEPSTTRAMAGAIPTAARPNGIRATLQCAAASSTLSATPAGGISPNGGVLDPNFSQFQVVGEIEERHELWGQPGKIKVTGFLSHGRAALFSDAIALAQATGTPADTALVRNNVTNRTGVSLNLEQQITETLGVFARAGWADGTIEPWDFTDVDRTFSGGVSINGKNWARPDDTIGIGGIVNGIDGVHRAYFNAGGLGILIGDGQLPNPGVEGILRDLLQLCADRFDAGVGRLSIHRQSGL